ncbi:homoserine dehydrogenase [Raineya sp.]|jgi:homoserine dehydrogenase
MNPKKLKIGLFGFGCVGQGLYDILNKNENFPAEVVRICIKHPEKPRPLDLSYFTTQAQEILENPEINLVVELIDNADEAFQIVSQALKRKKPVVTANKKMLAEHLPELLELQKQYQTPLLYEASACGSIPIIRTLEEYYDNEHLYAISGIFNGSTNYILTKIAQENLSYEVALRKAQELGFAESNPILDVGGFDPKYKLCILVLHAFGLVVSPDEVFNYGIEQFSLQDLQYAKEKGLKIKLINHAEKVSKNEVVVFLMPQLIDSNHPLFHVENETNGVIVEAAFSQKQIFIGKGAGGHPTGSAVLSDISASLYNYRYEYKKSHWNSHLQFTEKVLLEIYLRYNEEEELQNVPFEHISELYHSESYKYAIGIISLQKLHQIKPYLQEKGIFVAYTGKKIQPIAINQAKQTQKQVLLETI